MVGVIWRESRGSYHFSTKTSQNIHGIITRRVCTKSLSGMKKKYIRQYDLLMMILAIFYGARWFFSKTVLFKNLKSLNHHYKCVYPLEKLTGWEYKEGIAVLLCVLSSFISISHQIKPCLHPTFIMCVHKFISHVFIQLSSCVYTNSSAMSLSSFHHRIIRKINIQF